MYKVNYTPQSSYNTELYHHGVLGMKWGVRRYQDYGEGGYVPKDKLTKKKAKTLNRTNKRIINREANMAKFLGDQEEKYYRREHAYDYKIQKAEKKGNTEKAEQLKSKKDKELSKRADEINYYIQKNEEVIKAYSDYTEALIKSFDDKSFRKSDEFKEAYRQKAIIRGEEIMANLIYQLTNQQ